ncbi:MAG: hypothetical protein MUF20_10520 [Methylotetracoccus sp.]|nr:hypothetical protein [Methylotetracoccus sp.]
MDTTTPEQVPTDPAVDPESVPPRKKRLRRPEPQRTGPVRETSGYFRDSRSWGEEPHPAWREPSDVLDDMVTQGVKLGYRVIDEHIRQGRSAAAKMRRAEDDTVKDSEEMEELIERLQRLYKDVGALCFDALDVIARSPALLRSLARREQERDHGGAASEEYRPSAPPAGATIVIEVASRRRVQVNLNLPAHAGAYVPTAHALHAADPGLPPLTRITFRPDPSFGTPILEVEIPDQQPPALYTGVVVDRATNEPKGTLSVRILP